MQQGDSDNEEVDLEQNGDKEEDIEGNIES